MWHIPVLIPKTYERIRDISMSAKQGQETQVLFLIYCLWGEKTFPSKGTVLDGGEDMGRDKICAEKVSGKKNNNN